MLIMAAKALSLSAAYLAVSFGLSVAFGMLIRGKKA